MEVHLGKVVGFSGRVVRYFSMFSSEGCIEICDY